MRTDKQFPFDGRFTRIAITITPQILERLDAIAERQTSNRSLLIRQACEQFLTQKQTMQEVA